MPQVESLALLHDVQSMDHEMELVLFITRLVNTLPYQGQCEAIMRLESIERNLVGTTT